MSTVIAGLVIARSLNRQVHQRLVPTRGITGHHFTAMDAFPKTFHLVTFSLFCPTYSGCLLYSLLPVGDKSTTSYHQTGDSTPFHVINPPMTKKRTSLHSRTVEKSLDFLPETHGFVARTLREHQVNRLLI